MVDIPVPDQDGGGLVNLAAELERRLAGSAPHPGLTTDRAAKVPEAATYVLVLFDGLGSAQLDHPLASTLTGSNVATLDAPFPTTTTVSLATLATGLTPAEHGLIAYLLWDRAFGTIVNTIHLTSAWGDPAPIDVDRFLPSPNLFERLVPFGVEPVVVQPDNFAGSRLTRALYRGARFEGYRNLDDAVDVTVDVASHVRRLVILYVPHVDVAAHVSGQDSRPYADAVSAADVLWGRLAHRLDPGVTLVGTADHGHVDIGEGGKIRLSPDAEASARLWGDPRSLFVTGDPTRIVAETGGRWVPRDELVGMWGASTHGDAGRRRAPDGAVMMPDGTAAYTRYMNDRLVGHHGGLSDAERVIPLLVRT
jgi:hypothetical protein